MKKTPIKVNSGVISNPFKYQHHFLSKFIDTFRKSRPDMFSTKIISYIETHFVNEDFLEELKNLHYSGMSSEDLPHQIITICLKTAPEDRFKTIEGLQRTFSMKEISKAYYIADAAGIKGPLSMLSFCKNTEAYELT